MTVPQPSLRGSGHLIRRAGAHRLDNGLKQLKAFLDSRQPPVRLNQFRYLAVGSFALCDPLQRALFALAARRATPLSLPSLIMCARLAHSALRMASASLIPGSAWRASASNFAIRATWPRGPVGAGAS